MSYKILIIKCLECLKCLTAFQKADISFPTKGHKNRQDFIPFFYE